MSWLTFLLDLLPLPRAGTGPRGERAAARHLRRAGYRLLARNLRLRQGEIDILALAPDGRSLVVVEVKSRDVRAPAPASRAAGQPARPNAPAPGILPELRVNPAKRRRLVRLGLLAARRLRMDNRPMRFDIIGVDLPPRGHPIIRHHVCAFESHR